MIQIQFGFQVKKRRVEIFRKLCTSGYSIMDNCGRGHQDLLFCGTVTIAQSVVGHQDEYFGKKSIEID